MKEQSIIIKSLTYTHMGAVDSYHWEFSEGIQKVCDENPEITTCVLKRVMGVREACLICMHRTSRIAAQLQIGQNSLAVDINHIGSSTEKPIHIFPYLEAVTRTKEEQEFLCFIRPVGFHIQLQQYWECPESFVEWTTQPGSTISLSVTKTFRHYLRRFIRTFRPEKLLPDKNLWLQLAKDGRFLITRGKNGSEVCDLSETDALVFQYICFLQLRRFWNQIRRRSRYPAPILPVLIWDFSDRLDESVDYNALMERALEVSGQVIVL